MRAYYQETLENAVYYISKEFKKMTNTEISVSGICAVLIAFDYEHLCNIGIPAIDITEELEVNSKTHKFKLRKLPKKLKVVNNNVSNSGSLTVNYDYFSESEIMELDRCIGYLVTDKFPSKAENYIMYTLSELINS